MKIEVRNIYSRIINYNKQLNNLLSCYVTNYDKTVKYNSGTSECIDCGYKIDQITHLCANCRGSNLILKRKWNGKKYFIDYKGKFLTGFLPFIVEYYSGDYELIDLRDNRLNKPQIIIDDLTVWTLRDYQKRDVTISLLNTLDDIYFPRGIIDAATNYGKNSFMSSTYLSFDRPKTLLLVHRTELYKQAMGFFHSCGIEVIGYKGKNRLLGNFTVAMIDTLANDLKLINIKRGLEEVNLLFVDECHRASSNNYQKILTITNAYARYFVSGTSLQSDNETDHMTIIGSSGKELVSITNKELIDAGVSQRPTIYMINYNTISDSFDSYKDELIRLKFSFDKLTKIKEQCIKYSSKQILISVNHIDHGEFLLENLQSLNCIIEFVHGDDSDRDDKLERYRQGYTNILIATMILKEGINIPNINVLILAFGGKSTITIKQIIGRLLRNDGISSDCTVIDFNDTGKRSSKHVAKRIELYNNEQFKIIST